MRIVRLCPLSDVQIFLFSASVLFSYVTGWTNCALLVVSTILFSSIFCAAINSFEWKPWWFWQRVATRAKFFQFLFLTGAIALFQCFTKFHIFLVHYQSVFFLLIIVPFISLLWNPVHWVVAHRKHWPSSQMLDIYKPHFELGPDSLISLLFISVALTVHIFFQWAQNVFWKRESVKFFKIEA